MYKILLVSHGVIAKGFYDTLPMILGSQEDVAYLCFQEGMELNEFQREIETILLEIWKDEEILVLADMNNGTPARVAIQTITQHACIGKVLGGLNLQSLLEAYMRRTEKLDDVIKNIVEAGKPSFMFMNDSSNEENE